MKQEIDIDNEHPEIQSFKERAAIMEYDGELDREIATLEAAKLVWKREFTLTTLKIHLMSLRQGMGKAA